MLLNQELLAHVVVGLEADLMGEKAFPVPINGLRQASTPCWAARKLPFPAISSGFQV
jgi:hypothetical protein